MAHGSIMLSMSDYRAQLVDNCSFFSPREADIYAIVSREQQCGKFTVHVLKVEGDRREQVLSANGKSVMEAFKAAFYKSADAVQNYISTNDFDFVSTKKVLDGDGSDDDESDDNSSVSSEGSMVSTSTVTVSEVESPCETLDDEEIIRATDCRHHPRSFASAITLPHASPEQARRRGEDAAAVVPALRLPRADGSDVAAHPRQPQTTTTHPARQRPVPTKDVMARPGPGAPRPSSPGFRPRTPVPPSAGSAVRLHPPPPPPPGPLRMPPAQGHLCGHTFLPRHSVTKAPAIRTVPSLPSPPPSAASLAAPSPPPSAPAGPAPLPEAIDYRLAISWPGHGEQRILVNGRPTRREIQGAAERYVRSAPPPTLGAGSGGQGRQQQQLAASRAVVTRLNLGHKESYDLSAYWGTGDFSRLCALHDGVVPMFDVRIMTVGPSLPRGPSPPPPPTTTGGPSPVNGADAWSSSPSYTLIAV